MGVNWVALNNFAWMGAVNQPTLRFAADRTLGEGDTGQAMEDARKIGLKVFLKPHIWARDFGRAGKWHGDIAMTTEADWDAFFADYTAFMVACAKVAEEVKAEMFCVGVEYVGTSQQTARWRKVIAEVRKVYSGRLTYSAAFTEWKQIEFWDDLDVISVAAYFPLTDKDLASEAELRAGWRRVYEELNGLSRKTGKNILFSELGYTSAAKAGREPWSYEVQDPNEPYQALLFKVAIEEARKQPFMEGVFLWKWFSTEIPAEPNARFGREPFMIQSRPLVLDVLKTVWKGEPQR